MSLELGSVISLDVEKAAAGGRMLARHNGQVVLVWGAIPGERVQARVDRITKGVAFAETIEVLSAANDRREAGADWRCGGNVLAHVCYPRQLELKADIVRDAFTRIGRLPLPREVEVVGSPEDGYRMRARLHTAEQRLGFYREGTHQLCDASLTRQLLPATGDWIDAIQRTLREGRLNGIAALEIGENIVADQRACHLELQAGIETAPFARLADAGGLVGLSAHRADRPAADCLAGTPVVSDVLRVLEDEPASVVRLRRSVRAFFQSNRYLLEGLVQHVVGLVGEGPVVDLYAGVGLFGLSLATAGRADVTLVEGDSISGRDLADNAEAFRTGVSVERRSVEAFLLLGERLPSASAATFIIDPPRTGASKEATQGIIDRRPRRIIYISCDVATLARDARQFVSAGYELERATIFDMFPNTAHVETVVSFIRS